MAFCSQCGNQLDADGRYCPACGNEVKGAVSVPAQRLSRGNESSTASPQWAFVAIYAVLAVTMLLPWIEVGFFLGSDSYSPPIVGVRLLSLGDSLGAYMDEGVGVVLTVATFAFLVAWIAVFLLLFKGMHDAVKRPGQNPERPVTFLIALTSMTGLVCLMLSASGRNLGLGQSGLISVGASPWLWASLGLSVLALFVIELLPNKR